MSDLQKVFFIQDKGNSSYETESLWCIKTGEYLKIDNIPFVAKRVALGDIIKAEFDKSDGLYYFESFVEVSGNSTVRLYFNDGSKIQSTADDLTKMGCKGEILPQKNILAINIPKEVLYLPIKNFLEAGFLEGKRDYEEACLCHEY